MSTVSWPNVKLRLSILSLLVAVSSTQAQIFTLIADNRTPVPGGTGTFSGFYDNRAIHQNQVIFIGWDSQNKTGIYSFKNGQVTVVADTHTTVPGTSSLFSTFNDVDFCLRLREAGYRIVWTPYAELIHHESASRGFDNSAPKQVRFLAEVDYMKSKWGDILQRDPFYNPNLSLDENLFTLAFPPRTAKPWKSVAA